MEDKKVAIIGLGYVGLPLALLCSKKGYKTYGIDIDEDKIRLIREGINPLDNSKIRHKIFLSGEKALKDCNIIIICVPTPINENNEPDLKSLISATTLVKKYLKRNQLVIIESSTAPGIIDENIKPLLEEKMKAGEDFYLAHCPERIDPGNPERNIENIPRVIGACSQKGLEIALKFYSSIIDAKIKQMSSIRATEAVKMMENSFRDVNIAFSNELAKIFDKMNLDMLEIIKGASTKPFAFMPHYPGCGVGGHCIPVDPYYLIKKSEETGYEPKLLKTAREINNSMPYHTVELLKREIAKLGKDIKGARVGILGLSYKAEIGDLRNSPALRIMEILKKEGVIIETYDPYIIEKSTSKGINEILKKVEYIIICTDHRAFRLISAELLKNNDVKVVIDGKNLLNKETIKSKGILYAGIGQR